MVWRLIFIWVYHSFTKKNTTKTSKFIPRFHWFNRKHSLPFPHVCTQKCVYFLQGSPKIPDQKRKCFKVANTKIKEQNCQKSPNHRITRAALRRQRKNVKSNTSAGSSDFAEEYRAVEATIAAEVSSFYFLFFSFKLLFIISIDTK